jgi:hypothetical protein
MLCRTALSSALFFVSLCLYSIPVRAQTEQSWSPCPTSPTKTVDAPLEVGGDHPKVVIDEVRFDAPIHLPESVVDDVIAQWNEADVDATDNGWVNRFVEGGVRDAWQDRGYFRVTVGRAEAEPLGGDSHEQHFRISIPISEGVQYHLGELTFINASAFSSGELQNLIPLREGEIFDVSKIRAGIAALTKKYDAIGFIDFTAVPKTEIDDKLQRISLTLEFDEQKQYRIGEVRVVADPGLLATMGNKLVHGEIFDPTAIADFVNQHRSSLPANLSERDYLHATRNTRLGIADLYLDFRALDSRGCREAIR